MTIHPYLVNVGGKALHSFIDDLDGVSDIHYHAYSLSIILSLAILLLYSRGQRLKGLDAWFFDLILSVIMT